MSIQAICLVLAAAMDRSFVLPGDGLGLFEHPGILAILLADLVVLGLVGLAGREFVRIQKRLPVNNSVAVRRYMRVIGKQGRAFVLLQGRSRALFAFCAGIGGLFWLLNAIQTRSAAMIYGNDLFDASSHPAGYITFRAVLFLSWVVLYPYVFVAFVGMSGVVFRSTKTLIRHNHLKYRLFHPDGCGGFSVIGRINFAAIMTITVLYMALMSVVLVHQKLNVLQVSGFVLLSLAMVLITYLISWPVIRFLRERKKAEKRSNYRKIETRNDLFAGIKLLWISSEESFSPYGQLQRGFIQIVRMMPVVFAAIRLWAIQSPVS